jgi:hypothetical protein
MGGREERDRVEVNNHHIHANVYLRTLSAHLNTLLDVRIQTKVVIVPRPRFVPLSLVRGHGTTALSAS